MEETIASEWTNCFNFSQFRVILGKKGGKASHALRYSRTRDFDAMKNTFAYFNVYWFKIIHKSLKRLHKLTEE